MSKFKSVTLKPEKDVTLNRVWNLTTLDETTNKYLIRRCLFQFSIHRDANKLPSLLPKALAIVLYG